MKIVRHETPHSDVIEFIDTVFSGHTDLQSDIKRTLTSQLNKGIFSIQKNGEIQIVTCAYESTWHPMCTYIQVAPPVTTKPLYKISYPIYKYILNVHLCLKLTEDSLN